MRRLIILLALPVVLSAVLTPCSAQPPHVEWEHTFGGSQWDEGYGVQQTGDGGYIIVGYTGSGSKDICLIKTDASGNQLWWRTFGGPFNDVGNSVKQTTDGGYVIAGYTESFGAGSTDVFLIKTDASGNQVWQRTFGGSSFEWGNSVQQTLDGGYIITGVKVSYGLGYYDVYLVKTDASGNLIWQRKFGGPSEDQGYSVQQTRDGGYIIAGYTYSYGTGSDIYLIKTDSLGNQIWLRTFDEGGQDIGYGVQQTSDGGYIIVGYANSQNGDVSLIKTDASGNQVWQRTFGGSGTDYGRSVQQTSDGGYVIVGMTQYFGSDNYDIYLIKTDVFGNQIWQRTFGGNYGDHGYSVQQTSDGGYIIAGFTYSFGVGNDDVYLIKTNAGGFPLDLTLDLNPQGLPITIPSNGGSFDFNPTLINNGPAQAPFLLWARIRNPNGSYTLPLLGPYTLGLSVGMTISAHRTQNIPASWPAGEYEYFGYAGYLVSYPAIVADSFAFTKSTTSANGNWVMDSSCMGESFPGEEIIGQLAAPASGSDNTQNVRISPNPFNASTVLSFTLQAPSHVSLKVYGLSGRLVAALVEGELEPGAHEVTFEGSKLPSGLYFVAMQAGDYNSVQKIVLLK